MERLKIAVKKEEEKWRIDKLLVGRLPDLSRSRIQSLIASDCVRLDDLGITNANHRVKARQTIEIILPPVREPEPKPENIPLDIVYEDSHLLIVNKAAGMVVHPAPGNNAGTLVNALLFHCSAELKGIGGIKRPGIVHRIDKGTSGLMVVAKDEKTHHGLVELFARHDIARQYQALVWGSLRPPSGRIEGNIGRSPHNRKSMAVVKNGGKTAVTHYNSLKSFAQGDVTLVECTLETGRTHQIRVHMTHTGHPLLGDPLYGTERKINKSKVSEGGKALLKGFNRQALHAKSLGFCHPVTKKMLHFESDLPLDLKELQNCL